MNELKALQSQIIENEKMHAILLSQLAKLSKEYILSNIVENWKIIPPKTVVKSQFTSMGGSVLTSHLTDGQLMFLVSKLVKLNTDQEYLDVFNTPREELLYNLSEYTGTGICSFSSGCCTSHKVYPRHYKWQCRDISQYHRTTTLENIGSIPQDVFYTAVRIYPLSPNRNHSDGFVRVFTDESTRDRFVYLHNSNNYERETRKKSDFFNGGPTPVLYLDAYTTLFDNFE